MGLALFAGLGRYALQEPDEGRYSDVAAAIVRDGDWVTPRLNGIPYYSKPPLYFWLAAASMSVFGFGEAAARLPSAIASLLTVLLVCHQGWRLRGPTVGLLAALALASMPLFGLLERAAMVDPVLTLWVTAASYAGLRAFSSPLPIRRWILAFWLLNALALLTKGPVGLVLCSAPLVSLLVLRGGWRALRALLRPDGPALMLLVAVPWFAAMAVAHDDYLHQFFLENNVQRFADGGRFGRSEPWWFYGPVLLGGMLPWSLVLPASLLRTWRERRAGSSGVVDARSLWAFSLLVPLAFFSVSTGKLAYYLLPCCPPAALLAADYLLLSSSASRAGLRRRAWTTATWTALATSTGLAALAMFGWQHFEPLLTGALASDTRAQITALHAPAAVALSALTAGLGAAAWHAGRSRPLAAFCAHAIGFVAFVGVLPWVLRSVETLSVPRAVARVTARVRESGESVLLFGHYYRSIPFYLGDPVLLWVARHAEFGHASSEHDREFSLEADAARLVQRIHEDPSVLIIVSDEEDRRFLDDLVACPLRAVASIDEAMLFRSPCTGLCAPSTNL